MTASTVSPSSFPTTGILLLTTAFAVFAVIPSTELPSVPSSDNTPTNIVSEIPSVHITLDFKNFDRFDIWTLSEICETILRTVLTKIIGINMFDIIFPINVTMNKSIGPIAFAEIVLPVATINVISIGINEFEKPN